MTTQVTLSGIGNKLVIEIWQKNHIMGKDTRICCKALDPNEYEIVLPVWTEQYLIVREARIGEQI